VKILTLVLLLSIAAGAYAQHQPQSYVQPNQTLDLHEPKLVTAKQNCANWGLAAALETILAQQKVALDQNFWVMRLNYGEVCLDKLPSIDLLTKTVNQDFTLDDGGHVRLELHFAPNAPSNTDDVVAQLKSDQLSLLLWHGHLYYLLGVTYDETIRANGARQFQLKELRLADTLADHAAVTFQRGRDNAGEIEGILTLRVTRL
jgi:hypothetical protein